MIRPFFVRQTARDRPLFGKTDRLILLAHTPGSIFMRSELVVVVVSVEIPSNFPVQEQLTRPTNLAKFTVLGIERADVRELETSVTKSPQ
jgi:hypothetical protein